MKLPALTTSSQKNLPEETVQEVVEQALAAAFRRDYGDRDQEVRVSMNLNTGEISAYVNKEVVKEVSLPAYEISLEDAKKLKKDTKLGDEIEVYQKVDTFGRVAAQTVI